MTYTCADYRVEMLLVSLKRRLASADLSPREKEELKAQIKNLEADLGLGE